MWVLVALASAITIGIVLFGLYSFIKRRRARRRREGDAEGEVVSRGGGGSTRGSLPIWSRRRRSRRHDHNSQPASRWGWVYPHNRASTQSSEGLNELGEAPPPYNEDDLEPCLNVVDMAEVHHGLGLGDGPSRVASRQDRESLVGGSIIGPAMPGHPEPPAYDFAVNLGAAASTASVQPPAPAVVSESRSTGGAST